MMRNLKMGMLTLLGWSCAMSLLAQSFSYEGLNYRVLSENDKTAEVASNKSAAGAVVVPEYAEYNGQRYAVTTIGSCAFGGCKELTSLDMKYVTAIGYQSIYGCEALTSVNMPNVRTIGSEAFNYCRGLTYLDLKNVTTIGGYAFQNCSGLTAIDLKKVEQIGNCAFDACDGLHHVKVHDQVPVLGSHVFRSSTIVYVTNETKGAYEADAKWSDYSLCVYDVCQDEALYQIKSPAETTATYLADFKPIPEKLVVPGEVTFRGKTFRVDSIGACAFSQCDITSVDFNQVTGIGKSAFSGCMGLTSLDFKNVKVIGEDAFYNCDSLVTMDLKEVETIGSSAFSFCDTLSYVDFKNVKTIGIHAFSNCLQLTGFDLRDITVIGSGAFSNCSALTSVDLKKVTKIGGHGFKNCTGLTAIDLRRVTQVGPEAFWGCSGLTYVDLRGVKSVQYKSFKNCPNLKKVYVPAEAPFQQEAFERNTTLLIPRGGMPSYEDFNGGWERYHLVEYDFSVDQMDYNVLSEEEGTAMLIGPVVNIPAGHFAMQNVTYQGKTYCVTDFDPIVFSDCKTMTCFDSGDAKAIRSGSFAGCWKLDTLILRHVETIGAEAFLTCDALRSIEVHAVVPPVVEAENAFEKNVYLYGKLFVPVGCKAAYEAAPFWKNFQIEESAAIVNNEYLLTVAQNEGGKVSVDGRVMTLPHQQLQIKKGQQVVVKVVPDPDFVLTGISVNGADVTAQLVDQALTLTMDGMKTLGVSFKRVSLHLDDATDKYAATEASVVDRVTYTRHFGQTSWEPLYLPFALHYEDWQEHFEVAALNNVHQFDADHDGVYERTDLEVIRVNGGELQANTPYLIRAKEVGDYTFTLDQVSLAPAEVRALDCSSVRYLYKFTGTYEGLSGEEVAARHLYTVGEQGLLEDKGSAVGAFRWYLSITPRHAGAEVLPQVLRIVESDELTGIDAAGGASAGAAAIYDLNGRLVKVNASSTEGLQPGIYIVNGRKVMVK